MRMCRHVRKSEKPGKDMLKVISFLAQVGFLLLVLWGHLRLRGHSEKKGKSSRQQSTLVGQPHRGLFLCSSPYATFTHLSAEETLGALIVCHLPFPDNTINQLADGLLHMQSPMVTSLQEVQRGVFKMEPLTMAAGVFQFLHKELWPHNGNRLVTWSITWHYRAPG